MAIGKGGSSGNQSQAGSQQAVGNASNAGINGSVAMPIAPKGYEDYWNKMLAGGGSTPGQTAALGALTQPGGNSLLDPSANGWYGAVDRNNALGAFTDPNSFSRLYGTPTPTTPGQVTAQTGAAYMQPYQQGYTNDVVNATTADLTNQYGKALNASNMAGTAAGGFANSRMGLRDAQTTDDFLRTLGLTTGTLRDQGFGRAMQGGANDAGNALNASGQNASNFQQAQQFDKTLQNQRDQFGATTAIGATQAQMGNTATAANIANTSAANASNIGGNQFAQGLAALGAGTPLFGQSNKGGQLGANDTAGANNSTGSGQNSSKGGGVSVG